MLIEELNTSYASAERSSIEVIKRQSELFGRNKALVNLVDGLSQMMVVLNSDRQIIFSNQLFKDFCDLKEGMDTLGLRTGEAFNCLYSDVSEGGCGTSEFCKTCGAVNSILKSCCGSQSTNECQILNKNMEAIEVQATATPYDYDGEKLTIFTLLDISHKKRKETLERVFFHDILNSAGGISGLSNILNELEDPAEIADIAQTIQRAAENLIDEIQMQRQLHSAENGEMIPEFKTTNSIKILQELKDVYSRHELIVDKEIVIDRETVSVEYKTDEVLLRRVLGNMIKNALEVYNPGGVVKIKSELINDRLMFSVHNSKYMEKNIQLQLFKRSFSTKGIGRGVGTYSMKLFGEKYLGGKVGFSTGEREGTSFFIELPISPE